MPLPSTPEIALSPPTAATSVDAWLEPLRAYPAWFVFACVAVASGVAIWALAQMLKWTIYTAGFVLFLVMLAVTAWWLWG